MKALRNKTIATAVLGMLAGISLHASAGSVTEVTAQDLSEQHHQLTVNIADLDLDSAAGQQALYYRISSAAKEVCGSTDVRIAGGPAQSTRNKACYRESLSKAMSAVPRTAVASSN
ncbi:MAG: UrcA family protein [Halieaceae bacterium]|jgi:UrcA family protein